MASSWSGWEMTGVKEPLRAVERELPSPGPGEALVRVAGCGLCHTDLGFLDDGVRTRAPLPLVLGHEVAGWVVATGPGAEGFAGRAVVVPAVTPCGECADCRAGRPMVCARQVMPGNDVPGGFASHLVVPARGLCAVPGAGEDGDAPLGSAPGLTLRHLSVVADAVSTAWQAVKRSGLREGGFTVVIGLGGVGGYAAQITSVLGGVVAGLDIDPEKRAAAERNGAALALDPRELSPKDLKARLRELAKSKGCPANGWTILECSGTKPGQETAFGLLGPAATLMVVGFTMATSELRLSNLMAFDARALGNWGCAPELYPEILELVLAGRIDVVSGTEMRPLSQLPEAMDDARHHRAGRRLVLVPGR